LNASYYKILWYSNKDVSNDHLPTHFHAIYGENVGLIDPKTLEMIEGDLSNRTLKLVKEWAESYQDELMLIWDTKQFEKLEGLE